MSPRPLFCHVDVGSITPNVARGLCNAAAPSYSNIFLNAQRLHRAPEKVEVGLCNVHLTRPSDPVSIKKKRVHFFFQEKKKNKKKDQMFPGTWIDTLPSEVFEDHIVARLPVDTLLLWADIPLAMLRRVARERWRSRVHWMYPTGSGMIPCNSTCLVEVFDVDLPYDWTNAYRFFHCTPFTTHQPEELVKGSLFSVYPRHAPMLHLHSSWLRPSLSPQLLPKSQIGVVHGTIDEPNVVPVYSLQ